jgi:hypothetical protein
MLTSTVITLFLIGTAQSFTGSWVSNKKGFDVSLASTSEAGNVKKPLTAADILSRARKSVGVSTEEDADSSPATLLFDDHLLQDIQKASFRNIEIYSLEEYHQLKNSKYNRKNYSAF